MEARNEKFKVKVFTVVFQPKNISQKNFRIESAHSFACRLFFPLLYNPPVCLWTPLCVPKFKSHRHSLGLTANGKETNLCRDSHSTEHNSDLISFLPVAPASGAG